MAALDLHSWSHLLLIVPVLLVFAYAAREAIDASAQFQGCSRENR